MLVTAFRIRTAPYEPSDSGCTLDLNFSSITLYKMAVSYQSQIRSHTEDNVRKVGRCLLYDKEVRQTYTTAIARTTSNEHNANIFAA